MRRKASDDRGSITYSSMKNENAAEDEVELM